MTYQEVNEETNNDKKKCERCALFSSVNPLNNNFVLIGLITTVVGKLHSTKTIKSKLMIILNRKITNSSE